jgi:hypothetical protein
MMFNLAQLQALSVELHLHAFPSNDTQCSIGVVPNQISGFVHAAGG